CSLRICTAIALLRAGLRSAGAPPPAQLKSRRAEARPAGAAPRTIAVPPGGDLQAALERAAPGDVITLAPGATYGGPITLPKKTRDERVVIPPPAPPRPLPPPPPPPHP